ncbi:MAG: zf-HC2 domain-containing protein [Candidatus Marinimicrobia bacterium]|nr:zf-HC2 domain-containing protein [Candidatus Neomarinimicrobiota bacterium]
MAIKHLSIEEIDAYINGDISEQKIISVEEHLSQCEKCHTEVQQCQIVFSYLNKVKTYEPDDNFTKRVTTNLPDLYTENKSSFIEIISIGMILIPVIILIGLLLYNGNINFAFFGKLYSITLSIVHSIYFSFDSIQILSDNIDVIGIFLLDLIIFKILDWVIIQSKIKGFVK